MGKKGLFENRSVWHAVLTLAVPTVIGQIILVIYNIADTFFVSLTGRDEMISAVTVCLPAFMILSAISNLFGVGAAGAIGRALGKGKIRRARRVSSFAFWCCLFSTVLYVLTVLLLLHPLIRLLGGMEEHVHAYAASYMLVSVVFGGTAASMGALLAHLFRAEGRSVISAAGISLGGFLNIALDPLFMFVLLPKGFEVLGAAVATALSNLIAFLFFLVYFLRRLRHAGKKKTVLRFKMSAAQLKKMHRKKIPADVLRAGLPACLMTLFENVSYAVLGNLLARVSVAAHAGLGVAKKINMLAHSVVRGIAQGVLPLIAYHHGAGSRARMRKSFSAALLLSVLIATVWMGISLLFSGPLTGLFLQDASASRAFASRFLRILCIGAPFSACAYMMISFFQATGNGMKAFFLAVLRKGALDIPLMFLFAAIGSSALIVAATPAADFVCCTVAVILFVPFLKEKRAQQPVKRKGGLHHD